MAHFFIEIQQLLHITINTFRQIPRILITVDNLAHILPVVSTRLDDFANNLITGYPPSLWIKERLFSIKLFGRLNV